MIDVRTLPSLDNLPDKHQQALLEIVKRKQQVRGNQTVLFWTTLTLIGYIAAVFLHRQGTPVTNSRSEDAQQGVNVIFKTNNACYAKIGGDRKPDIAELKGGLLREEVIRGISVCFGSKDDAQKYLQAVNEWERETAFRWDDFLWMLVLRGGLAGVALISFCVWWSCVYKLSQAHGQIKLNFTQLVLAGVEPVEVRFLLKELDRIDCKIP